MQYNRLKEALESLDLKSWLEKYVSLKYVNDSEYRIKTCPKCGDERHKLYVNTEKKIWICFHCDWGRGLRDVVHLMSDVSGRSLDSIRIELAKTVIPSSPGDLSYKLTEIFDKNEHISFNLPNPTEIEIPGTGFDSLSSKSVLGYAFSRGLSLQDIETLKLKSCISLTINEKCVKGPFLIFPVFIGQKSVSWQGRRINKLEPKYISAKNLHEWLWPLDLCISTYSHDKIILVEGVFDALGFLRMGYPALCTFGKTLSEMQLSILRELHPKEVIFSWDVDAYREIRNTINLVSHIFPITSVIDFTNSQGIKIDPGDSLNNPSASKWVNERFNNRINTKSLEFFQWEISKI